MKKSKDSLEFQEVLESEKIYDGKIFNVKKDTVRLPNGEEAKRDIVVHNGGVCVIAVKDGYTYLVSQFRNPALEVLVELPAGKLELGEDPKLAALRELSEETGLVAKDIHSLGKIYTTPGFCTEIIYMYYVDEFEEGAQHLDEGEYLQYNKVTLEEMNDMIKDGRIIDAKTIATFFKYLQVKDK